MAETTPNIGLKKPIEGEEDWDTPLRETIDILDTVIAAKADLSQIEGAVAVEEAARIAADNLRILLTQKGVPDGVATLDGTGVIPVAQLPGADALDAEVAAAIADHETDPAGHIGTSIANTPAGNIAATTVQAAINELDAEKALIGATPPRPVPHPNPTMISSLQTGHGFVDASAASASLNDTTDFVLGSQAAKIVTLGTATAATLSNTALPAVNLTGKQLLVWVKIDDVARLRSISLYVSNVANFASYYLFTLADTFGSAQPIIATSGDWVLYSLNFADGVVTGTPDRSAIIALRLRIQDDGAGAVTAHFNGVAHFPEPTAWPNGVMSITFDDTYQSQYDEARKKMDQYGFPATVYVIADQVGSGMTADELRRLEQLNGWEVAGHSFTSAAHLNRFTSLSAADLDTELRSLKNWLMANGFGGAEHLAWPGGIFNEAVIDVARRYFSSARTTAKPSAETTTPGSPFRLRCYNGVTLATIQAQIDAAYANKSWLILSFHKIESGPTSGLVTNIADFAAIIDYIATKGIAVRTVGNVLSRAAESEARFLDARLAAAKGDLFVATADDTVVRLAAGSDGKYLVADSAATTGVRWASLALETVLTLPGATGEYASMPDSATVSITGDFEVMAKITPNSWLPATQQTIGGKYETGGGQKSHYWSILTNGKLRLLWFDGTTALSSTSTVATGFVAGTMHFVKATIDVDDGAGNRVVSFFTSADNVTWIPLGTPVTTAGTTAIFDSTAKLTVGAYGNTGANEPFAGRIHYFELRNGIGGTIAAYFDANAVVKTATRTPATVTQGANVWTLNGTAWDWSQVAVA